MAIEPEGLPPRGSRRIVALAEGMIPARDAKTAFGVVRYAPDTVVAFIDSTAAGKQLNDFIDLGERGAIPIVADITDALRYEPNTLLIGIAPRGGSLPEEWRGQILTALERGIHVISGLHMFLGDDPEFAAAARKGGATIWDVRRPPDRMRVTTGEASNLPACVVLTVGADCSIGKMTVALELDLEARRRGYDSSFLATGQTGMIVYGNGITIDRVIGDFMAGLIEELVIGEAQQHTLVFVEGQGSLLHMAYSGVTLALLHGSQPDAQILCLKTGRDTIRGYDTPIPPVRDLVRLYETMAGMVKPAPVVAIAVNTADVDEATAHAEIERVQRETGLPTTDPVRFGAGPLIDALEKLPKFKRFVG